MANAFYHPVPSLSGPIISSDLRYCLFLLHLNCLQHLSQWTYAHAVCLFFIIKSSSLTRFEQGIV